MQIIVILIRRTAMEFFIVFLKMNMKKMILNTYRSVLHKVKHFSFWLTMQFVGLCVVNIGNTDAQVKKLHSFLNIVVDQPTIANRANVSDILSLCNIKKYVILLFEKTSS